MVSRFSWFHRILCVVLALVTVFFTLSPAIVQPADAVAVVDDMALAVGLLFATWSGITFPTTAAARKGITNFFNYNPTSYKVCSTVASDYVRDGKLALVEAVRDHYITTLYDIARFFHPADESSTSGTIVNGAVVGASYSVPVQTSGMNYDQRQAWLKSFPTFIASPDVNYRFTAVRKSDTLVYDSVATSSLFYFKVSPSGSTQGSIPLGSSFLPYIGSNGYVYFTFLNSESNFVSTSSTLGGVVSATISILSADEESEIPFTTTPEVKDLALSVLEPAPAIVPFPDGSLQPTDPSNPDSDTDLKNVAFFSLAAVISAILGSSIDSVLGLDPKQMIEELQKAMDAYKTQPSPEPDPDPGGDSGGSSGSASSPSFDDMKLPGLKDFFPFCIPFDLYAMMQALCADPVAPSFTFATSFLGHVYTVDIDLSAWNDVATVVRYMVVAIYIVALAVATRKFIKW